MNLTPLPLREANRLVSEWHRHHRPVRGAKYAIGVEVDGEIVGAVIVGRPVARMLQDGYTAEATRVVTDGAENACSMLYAAAWRAWKAMGGRRMITYTLVTEPGTSLIAAGWKVVHQTRHYANGWDRPSRPRVREPQQPKTLWEAA